MDERELEALLTGSRRPPPTAVPARFSQSASRALRVAALAGTLLSWACIRAAGELCSCFLWLLACSGHGAAAASAAPHVRHQRRIVWREGCWRCRQAHQVFWAHELFFTGTHASSSRACRALAYIVSLRTKTRTGRHSRAACTKTPASTPTPPHRACTRPWMVPCSGVAARRAWHELCRAQSRRSATACRVRVCGVAPA